MRFLIIVVIILNIAACTSLGNFVLDSISSDKGGINTELIVGDKEQTLGTNQDVKAETIGKVVGVNDNSLDIATATGVVVTNQNYPGWLILLLLAGNVVFLCLPTPTSIFKYFKRSQ